MYRVHAPAMEAYNIMQGVACALPPSDTQAWPAAHRCKPVQLIKEYDGRLHALRLVKQVLQLPLGLAHPLGQQVCAPGHEEGDLLPVPGAL